MNINMSMNVNLNKNKHKPDLPQIIDIVHYHSHESEN